MHVYSLCHNVITVIQLSGHASYRHPYTLLLYSIIGVYRGIHYLLTFALKHRLWVLVRTASIRRF